MLRTITISYSCDQEDEAELLLAVLDLMNKNTVPEVLDVIDEYDTILYDLHANFSTEEYKFLDGEEDAV